MNKNHFEQHRRGRRVTRPLGLRTVEMPAIEVAGAAHEASPGQIWPQRPGFMPIGVAPGVVAVAQGASAEPRTLMMYPLITIVATPELTVRPDSSGSYPTIAEQAQAPQVQPAPEVQGAQRITQSGGVLQRAAEEARTMAAARRARTPPAPPLATLVIRAAAAVTEIAHKVHIRTRKIPA